MKLIFFGAGYCSKYIIPILGKKFQIICTHNEKIKPEIFDKDCNVTRITFKEFTNNVNLIKNATHVINSIPPINGKDLVYEFLLSLKNQTFNSMKWFCYLSSTSVYGNHYGRWVDEKTIIRPKTSRGISRKNVEDLFLRFYHKKKIPLHIFRLPGIYGPGRSALDKLIKKNKIVIRKKNQYFSRIHVEDIASAIICSINKVTPGEIFNITDNYPCSAYKVTKYAARLLNIKDLNYVDIDSSEINYKIKDFYSDNKKVSNKKIKKILGWTPKFENYKLGIETIYKQYING